MKTLYSFVGAFVLFCSCLCSCSGKEVPSNGKETEDLPEVMVKFISEGSKETFQVALQDETVPSKYFIVSLNHYKDLSEEKYMNLWRINGAVLALWKDGNFTTIVDRLLTDGENECVIRDYSDESTMADFTGGFHGDERIDIEEGCGVEFLADGKPVDISASFEWLPCSKFSYRQLSTLHKTGSKINGSFVASDHRKIAIHEKVTTFESSSYATRNSLTFSESLPMYWYCGICCVGHNLADRGCNEDMKMVTFDSSGDNKLDAEGKCEFYAWHDINGVEVFIQDHVLEGATDLQTRSFIWDTGNYAKYYKRFPSRGGYEVSAGESFVSEMIVKFAVR